MESYADKKTICRVKRRVEIKVIVLAILTLLTSLPAWASEAIDPCVPSDIKGRHFEIPPKLGKMLLDDDRARLDTKAIHYWWGSEYPDPNILYTANKFNLSNSKYDGFYVISVNPDGPDASFAPNGLAWIVLNKPHENYVIVLRSFSWVSEPPRVLKSTKKQFPDICVLGTDGQSTYYSIFKYKKNKYVANKCYKKIYDGTAMTGAIVQRQCDEK